MDNIIDVIKSIHGLSGDYVDLPSINPKVSIRIEKDEFFLIKASEGFCECIPMEIKDLEDVNIIERIFGLRRFIV